MAFRRNIAAIFLVLQAFSMRAQVDSTHYNLDESLIRAEAGNAPVRGNLISGLSFSAESIQSFPKLLGEVDPVRVLQTLPGIVTTGDGKSGLYVQGCDDSHNHITINGAPVYLNQRLMGFIPMMNNDHFGETKFRTTTYAPMLGSSLAFNTDESIPQRISGNASLGLISAKATARIPAGDKFLATLSVRQSYLNLVYRNMLRFGDSSVGYDFTDANASFFWKPSTKDKVDASIFFSRDATKSGMSDFGVGLDARWYSANASVRWRHFGQDVHSELVAYTNANVKDFFFKFRKLDGKLPSDLHEYGIRNSLDLPLDFFTDIEFVYRRTQPQGHDYNDNGVNYKTEYIQHSSQLHAGVGKVFNIGMLQIKPYVKATAYWGDDKSFHWAVDPQLDIEYNMGEGGRLVLSGGGNHQFFSSAGIIAAAAPVKITVAAGSLTKPQQSWFAELSHSVSFLDGMLSMNTQVYWKILYNQLHYRGFLFDMMQPDYDFRNYLYHTDGQNWGASVMLRKDKGKLTGWISYSYSKTFRKDAEGVVFPADFERPHEFNAVASYKIWKFDIGATLVVASGNPYTPAEYFYLVDNKMVTEYGPYNSAYLPPLLRLDLSLDYHLPSLGRYSHGLNLSVLNATAHKNVNMYALLVNPEDGTYSYSGLKFAIPVIPSISYFCKF